MKTVQLLKSEEFEIGTTDKNGHKLRQSDFVVTQDDFEGISICQILYNSIGSIEYKRKWVLVPNSGQENI
ncbi:Uncharacterised protein [Streptococcus pneumoniae]|nr:Uncharacterised protein [Streptococcus pneumoniae]